jgi:phosphoribosylpyrophosphate synthetase
MNNYFVIGSPNSENLVKKLQVKYLKTTLKIFSVVERKLTISGRINKETIIVVSSIRPPVDSNLV